MSRFAKNVYGITHAARQRTTASISGYGSDRDILLPHTIADLLLYCAVHPTPFLFPSCAVTLPLSMNRRARSWRPTRCICIASPQPHLARSPHVSEQEEKEKEAKARREDEARIRRRDRARAECSFAASVLNGRTIVSSSVDRDY